MRQSFPNPHQPGVGSKNKLVYLEPCDESFMVELYLSPAGFYFFVVKELNEVGEFVERATGLNHLRISLAYDAAMKAIRGND